MGGLAMVDEVEMVVITMRMIKKKMSLGQFWLGGNGIMLLLTCFEFWSLG